MQKLISYQEKNTWIHQLSGFTKLLFFILWCLTSALTYDTRILLVMIVIGASIFVASKTEWKQVSMVFKAVMFFMVINLLCIFFFSPYHGCGIYGSRTDIAHLFGNYYLTKEQLFYEFNVLIKYFTVIPAVFIFLVTTDPSELAASLNGVGVPYTIAYSVAIALRYIPDIQGDFRRIRNAQEARGIEMSAKAKLMDRIKRTAVIIFPLLFSTMERINVVSNAMELRGFGKKKKRTWYAKRSLRRNDYLVIAFSVLFMTVTMIITYRDGNRFYNPFEKTMESILPVYSTDTANELDTFNILTCVRKLKDRWFLVDCYHDRILYSDDLEAPPAEWKVLTREIKHGHTIDSDGQIYLADDTENNRVLVFQEDANGFQLTGEFPDIGTLPHFVTYDENSKRFYVLSSMTGELFIFKNHNGEAVLERVNRIEELNGSYVRSFTIIGDEVYFVSGNSNIIRARLSDLKVLERYPVSPDIAGMVQLEKIGDYFYITVSTDASFDQDYATIIRTKDLHDLAANGYEDMYNKFIGGGTPYYLGSADSHFYLTEHRLPDHQLWQFDVIDNKIVNVTALH